MHRRSFLKLLLDYKVAPTSSEEDQKMADRFIQFILLHENCFDRALERGHITASCLLLNSDRTSCLFTHHKKLKKWLQLGGHADNDPDVLNVSLREAVEESGISCIKPVSTEIFDLDIHLIPANKNEKKHYHYDVRFLLEVEKETPYKISDESIDLKWIKIDEFEKHKLEKSILKMKEKLKNFIQEPLSET